jgi:L-asparaginase
MNHPNFVGMVTYRSRANHQLRHFKGKMPAMNSAIRVIATGGTFDKTYNPLSGELEFTHSHLESIFHRCRLVPHPVLQPLMLMDSLDMTDEHRGALLKAILNSPQDRVVVTHGTDTMVESARVVGLAAVALKTIVFTGAMVPLTITQSDAEFNLGFALGCVQSLKPGVYIAMNGQVHPWDQVKKNRALGIFETIEK